MVAAFFSACALLLVGFVLRARFRILQILYIPASVLGGILGLVLVTIAHRITWAGQPQLNAQGWLPRLDGFFQGTLVELRAWPSWLIAVIFAAMLLEKPARSFRDSLRGTLRQGVVVWIIVVGEIMVGLAATWLLVRPFYGEVPGSFGQLIEAGFAGGHSTAAALGDVFDQFLHFPAGRDLGFFFATMGLVYGVASGILLVNLGVRRGWTRSKDVKVAAVTGLGARSRPGPIAYGRVDAEVIDPLVFQLLIVASAFVVGMALKALFMWVIPPLVEMLGGGIELRDQIIRFAVRVPLFIFTLVAGLLVRELMRLLKIGDLIDPDSIRRIVGAAIEFLIVAAIASMKLSVLVDYGLPSVILLLCGFAWTVFCLLVVARRLLPKAYWFELGILNYGMSTGTTAQGMMLLRIIDKDLESGASEDYAMAAPLSAPFIGGGVLTLVVLPSLLQSYSMGWIILGLAVLLVVLFALGLKLADGDPNQ